MSRPWFLALATIGAFGSVQPSLDAPAADSKTVEVSVDEIGTRTTLIGRLKRPLGTMMTVRGKWSYPASNVKDSSLRFTITDVNGEKLPELVELNIAQVQVVKKDGKDAIPPYEQQHKRLDGTQWTIRAFETGRFAIIPNEYWKEQGSGPHATAYWTRVFTSELIGVLQP